MPLHRIAHRRRIDWARALALAGLAFVVYIGSPVQQVIDSRYALLLSEQLWSARSFRLDAFFQRPLDAATHPMLGANGLPYNIEDRGGHALCWHPPGVALASVPFAPVWRALGMRIIDEEGRYSREAEERAQRFMAALLMAAFVALSYNVSRAWLAPGWAASAALAAGLATPAWSVYSRGMWAQTWGSVLLLGAIAAVMKIAARAESQGLSGGDQQRGVADSIDGARVAAPRISAYAQNAVRSGRSAIIALSLAGLGALLSLLFFIQPTYAVSAAVIFAFLALRLRRAVWPMAAAGAAGLALFFLYSWTQFDGLLPSYFEKNSTFGIDASHRETNRVWRFLLSPSRGALVYLPLTVWMIYWSARRARTLFRRPLFVFCWVGVVAQFALLSSYMGWWAGFSYGNRLSGMAIPWLVPIGAVALADWLEFRRSRAARWIEGAALTMALAFGVFVHARGALDDATWNWNMIPTDIREDRARMHDWRQPQFLAGWLPNPPPRAYPPLPDTGRLDFGGMESRRYLWNGWADWPDAGFHWSDGHEAEIVFALDDPATVSRLVLNFFVFAPDAGPDAQRVIVEWNGKPAAELTVRPGDGETHGIDAPDGAPQPRNRVRLSLPDAQSPAEAGMGVDKRRLAVALRWLQIE